jgi:hypothetical protein
VSEFHSLFLNICLDGGIIYLTAICMVAIDGFVAVFLSSHWCLMNKQISDLEKVEMFFQWSKKVRDFCVSMSVPGPQLETKPKPTSEKPKKAKKMKRRRFSKAEEETIRNYFRTMTREACDKRSLCFHSRKLSKQYKCSENTILQKWQKFRNSKSNIVLVPN